MFVKKGSIYGKEIIEKYYESFDKAVQDHFEQFNVEEDEASINARIEVEAMKKFQKIQEDQNRRLKNIQLEIEALLLKGNLIETFKNEVQGIIDICHGFIDTGMGNMIKISIQQGKNEGDKLALMIKDVSAVRLKGKNESTNHVKKRQWRFNRNPNRFDLKCISKR